MGLHGVESRRGCRDTSLAFDYSGFGLGGKTGKGGRITMADTSNKLSAAVSELKKRLSPAELFAKYDEDSNGAIDNDEVSKLFDACNYTLDNKSLMNLMAEFSDGMEEELSFAQFSAMLRALDKRILFKQYDEDGSGAIDAFELALMLEVCGHDSSPDFVAGLIERHSKSGKTGSELDVEGFGEALAELDAKGGEKLAPTQKMSLELGARGGEHNKADLSLILPFLWSHGRNVRRPRGPHARSFPPLPPPRPFCLVIFYLARGVAARRRRSRRCASSPRSG